MIVGFALLIVRFNHIYKRAQANMNAKNPLCENLAALTHWNEIDCLQACMSYRIVSILKPHYSHVIEIILMYSPYMRIYKFIKCFSMIFATFRFGTLSIYIFIEPNRFKWIQTYSRRYSIQWKLFPSPLILLLLFWRVAILS